MFSPPKKSSGTKVPLGDVYLLDYQLLFFSIQTDGEYANTRKNQVLSRDRYTSVGPLYVFYKR